MKTTQPSAAVASALQAFLNWTITTGNADRSWRAVGFEPLPSNVATIAADADQQDQRLMHVATSAPSAQPEGGAGTPPPRRLGGALRELGSAAAG